MSVLWRESGPGNEDQRKKDPRRGPARGGPPRKPQGMVPQGRPFRTLAFWALVVLLTLMAYRMYQGSFMTPQRVDISYTRFIQEVDRGNIRNLQIIEKTVTGELENKSTVTLNNQSVPFSAFKTNILGDGSTLPDRVWKKNPDAEIDVRTAGVNWMSILFTWLPLVMIFGAWLFLMRQVQAGGSAALKFGKTKAKVLLESTPKVTFKDVAGCDEAKQELQEIIEFLKEPQKFQRLGGRIPKGALLLGPPGSGKTLLAKAVAGEANVPFFSMSGSDFVEMFVGVGASRVRDLFEQGKRNAPCLTGDSVVVLSGGKQVTIEEMFEKRMLGVKVPAMGEGYRFEDATVIGITKKPSTELFTITTATSQIRATGNHLFPVLRPNGMEWVRADRLTTEDSIAAPRWIGTSPIAPCFTEFMPEETMVRFEGDPEGRRLPRLKEVRLEGRRNEVESYALGAGGFGSSSLSRVPVEVNVEVGYLCGLLASAGTSGSPGDRSILFANTEIALHERVDEILQLHFGYQPKRPLAKKHFDRLLPRGRLPESLRDCYITYIDNRLLCESLRGVQSRILEMPGEVIAAWIRGVFDGDGCVRLNETNPQVTLSAWDATINPLIRDALLRIGIPTSFSNSARDGRDGNIVISGRDMLMHFSHRVHSEHPEKAEKLRQLCEWVRDRSTSDPRFDSIPLGGLLRDARKSMGMGQRDFRRGHDVSSWERGRVAPSRGSLQATVLEMEEWCETDEVGATPQFEEPRDLASSSVHWSRIRRIDIAPSSEPVYDLCLDRVNCFIANNLVVHNCIVFIDEIDAVGRHRGAGLGGGHDEREQTLNQLLVEMDGFDSNEGVIMIAATNRPDVLDPALLRPGRFDRQIVVDWPDVRGREGILKVHTRNKPLADDVDLKQIARATPGMAGADLANLVNEAALLAARRNKKKISLRDFDDAKDKVMLGMERKSLVMSDEERRSTAFHEAGHALVGWLLPGSDPVDKITIIPRGRALGVTSYLPTEERYSRSKEDLERTLCMMMGGRAAEYLVFNHLTTGAANDLERATGLARRMVCELGMSENLGPLTFGKKEEMVFLGREISSHKDYSEETAERIDQEVRLIVEGAYNRAMSLLRDNLDKLQLIAKTLLEREVLDGEEMNKLLRGERLEPLKPVEEPPQDSTPAAPEEQPARRPEGLEGFPPPAPRPAGA